MSPSTEDEPRSPNTWHNTVSTIGVLLLAPVLALLLTTFVFQSYQVSGYSMQNTLQDHDRLIVWKGSRTWAKIIGSHYIPNRGDIIIVNQKDLTACGQDGKQIVKRVIGLPGDRVVYKDGQYTVYNAVHPDGFDPDTSLPYGKSDTPLLEDGGSPSADVQLSADQVFVSGDHRADSCDSRYFGPVNVSDIIGKVVERIYPFSDIKRF